MAENKTRPTDKSVADYIAAIEPESRREDCQHIHEMMKRLSGWEPKMWGPTIVGYGEYHYKYESGREGDAYRIGFSSRAQNISLYIMPGYGELEDALGRLGKHKVGKSCLYIKRLSDIDEAVLEEIILKGLSLMAEKYPL